MVNNKNENLFDVHEYDSRKLNDILHQKIIDVTITSPPYFDLKDYGHKEQIGYGQDYEEYLNDLVKVFRNVYNCTKDTGTLWVIIDSFRRDGEVVPLPFDFSNKIKSIGWKLKDVIIWEKDRTVPWVHKGQMRNLFEYILVFAKSDNYNFYIDEVRDSQVLKKWWIRYPERYNPKGKTPAGVWEFDIPTQGSWGNGYIKHFCPLPEEMIEQILKITTKEGDVVLDPFAGSGAVLAKADNMQRKYIGFELNNEYIEMFKNYLKETGNKKKQQYVNQQKSLLPQVEFENLNLNLRALKFGRILYRKMPDKIKRDVIKIYVRKTAQKSVKKNIRCIIEYRLYVSSKANSDELKQTLSEIISKPPLSKFGIDPIFLFEKNINQFLIHLNGGSTIYTYTEKSTHQYSNSIKEFELAKTSKAEIILSKIKVDLSEKDYE
jgi:DNA modification methylase